MSSSNSWNPFDDGFKAPDAKAPDAKAPDLRATAREPVRRPAPSNPFADDAGKPDSAATDAPRSEASSANVDTDDSVRGSQRLGLVGFPNSGKTSWLYSLVHGHRNYSIVGGAGTHAKGQRAWLMGAVDNRFASMIGAPGQVQPATPLEVFKRRRFCQMKRPWIPGLPFSTKFWLSIPEVSGENVKVIAGLQEAQSDEQRRAAEGYLEFLGDCQAIVCLAGIDCTDDAAAGLRIDSALAPAFGGFELVLGQALKRRSDKKHAIAVTVMVTKIDALKTDSALDEVVIERAHSSLHKLAADKRYAELAAALGSDPEYVRFRVNALLQSDLARGNLVIQECIAADFIRRHAPQAAQCLARLCEIEGLDVRFYLCAPYGTPSKKSDGQATFPKPEVIKPTMVYEPLEDVLERAWKARAGTRLHRNVLVAALIMLLLAALGPGWAYFNESRFDALATNKASWTELAAARAAIESHPLFAFEQSISQPKRSEHAARLLELRGRMVEGGASPEELAEVESSAFELDRDATLRTAGRVVLLADQVASRDLATLTAFLSGERQLLPDQRVALVLQGPQVEELAVWLGEFVDTRKTPEQWAKLSQRLGLLDSGSLSVEASDRGDLLEHLLRQLAMTAKAYARDPEDSPLDDGEMADTARAFVGANRLEDAKARDAELVKRSREGWAGQLASADRGEPDPQLMEFMQDAPSVDWLRPLHGTEAQRALLRWIGALDGRIRARIATLPLEGSGAELLAGTRAVADELVKRRDRMDALREAHPELFEGVDSADLDAVRFEPIIERQAAVNELNASASLTDAIRSRLMQSFGGDEPKVPERLGISPEMVAVLVVSQRMAAMEILDQRFESVIDSQDPRPAELALETMDAVSGNLEADAEVRRARLEVARATTERAVRRADFEPAFRNAIAALLSDPNALDQHGAFIARRVARCSEFPKLVKPTLDAIASCRAPGDKRGAWTSGFLRTTDARRWSEVPPDSMPAIFEAFFDLGVGPAVVARALTASPQEQAVVKELPAAARRSEYARIEAVVRALQRRSTGVKPLFELIEPTRSALGRSFERARTSADLAAGTESDLATKLLEEVARYAGSPEIAAMASDCRNHARLIDRWKLVRFGVGSGSFWISPTEWTEQSVMDVALERKEQWAALLAQKGNLPFDASGKRKPKWPEGTPTQHLGVKSAADAAVIAEAAGLRLPTTEEWNAAHRDVSAVPAIPAFKTEAERSDCSPMTLKEKYNDITRSGVIGMRFGVHEWVADSPNPMGGSNNAPDDRQGGAVRTAGNHIGLRPALDVLPKSLR
ncbi:MAG: hypothetical protein ACKOYN_08560 [Planctomycetota bacterium]